MLEIKRKEEASKSEKQVGRDKKDISCHDLACEYVRFWGVHLRTGEKKKSESLSWRLLTSLQPRIASLADFL